MKRGFNDDKFRIDNKKLMKMINPKKIRILKILKKEPILNQTQLKRKMNISYRQTKRYIDSLFKVGLLNKKRPKKRVGNPVFISLKKPK